MKSYVTMVTRQCIICDKEFETNELMIDRRLRNQFEMKTKVGIGICPDHKKEGYIVLIGIDPERSTRDSVYKTGEVVHIKKKVFHDLFRDPPMAGEDFTFIDQATILKLQEMMEGAEHG
jgi:hypothetical protein